MQSSSVCLSAPPRREACVTQGGSASAYPSPLDYPSPPPNSGDGTQSLMHAKQKQALQSLSFA